MKPVCVPCERFMRMKKSGYYFLEGMPIENRAEPGIIEPEKWKPYKLWAGDLYECPTCGASTIVGTGMSHIAEHYQKDFAHRVEMFKATLLVKDC
jgi:hypothetical protein